MAIAFDAASSAYGNNVSSLTFQHTNVGNLLLVAAANGDGTIATVSGVTFNGVACTLKETQPFTFATVEVWYLVSPSVATGNIVITYTSSQARVLGGAASFSGVDTGTPLGTAAKATNTTGSPSSVTASSATNNVVFATVYVRGDVTNPLTPGSPATARYDVREALFQGDRLAGSTDAGAASVTMTNTWTGGQGSWGAIGVSIKPSAGAVTWGPLLGLARNRLVVS